MERETVWAGPEPRTPLKLAVHSLCWAALFLKSELALSPNSEITPCGSGNLSLEQKEAVAVWLKSEQVCWGCYLFLLEGACWPTGWGSSCQQYPVGAGREAGVPNKQASCLPAFIHPHPHPTSLAHT